MVEQVAAGAMGGRLRKALAAKARAAFEGNQLVPREAALREWLAAGLGLRELESVCKMATRSRGLVDMLPKRVVVELLESGNLDWWSSESARLRAWEFDREPVFERLGTSRSLFEPLQKAIMLAVVWPDVGGRWESGAKLCLAHGAWARAQAEQAWPTVMDLLDGQAEFDGFVDGKEGWQRADDSLSSWSILGIDPALTGMARERAERAAAKGRTRGEWRSAALYAIGEDSPNVLQAMVDGAAKGGVDLVGLSSAWAENGEAGLSLPALAAMSGALECFELLMKAGAPSARIGAKGKARGVAEVLKGLGARVASKPEAGALFLSYSMVAAAELRALGMSAGVAARAVEEAGSNAFPKGGSLKARSAREDVALNQALALAGEAKGLESNLSGEKQPPLEVARRATRI